MIKFVASDLDGTLLVNGATTLSPEAVRLIQMLTERGILFAAASGRQYPNMKRLFHPIWRDIAFICENGSLIMYHDEVVHQQPIPRDMGQEIIKDILSNGFDVLLSGKSSSYMAASNRTFTDYMVYELRNTVTIVKDLLLVDEEYLKISAFLNQEQAKDVAPYFQRRWGKLLNTAIAGDAWVDFSVASKGSALLELQRKMGFQKEEMMAFGDNFNDEPMLRAVAHSYAMASADDGVKRAANHVCCRVEDTLKEVFSIDV